MARLTMAAMPFKNLMAHPVRTLVLMLLAALQAACVVGGAAFTAHTAEQLAVAEARLGADVLVYPYAAATYFDMNKVIMQGTPIAAYGSQKTLARMAECDGIDAVSYQIYIPGPEGGPAWVIGFDPQTDFTVAPWYAEGRSLVLGAGSVAVGCAADDGSGFVELYGRSWPVGAHLEQTGSALDGAVYVGMDDLQTVIADAAAAGAPINTDVVPSRDYSVALVRVSDKASVESVANWLKVYVTKTKTVQSDEDLTDAAAGVQWQAAAVGGLSAAAWAVLLAAVAVAQSMSLKERRAELFVWRAVGASRRVAARALRREALMAHGAGALAGALSACAVAMALLPAGTLSAGGLAAVAAAAVALGAAAGWASAAATCRKAMGALDGQMLMGA